MNFAKAYESVARPISEEDKLKQEVLLQNANTSDPARAQLLTNWQNSTVTKEMFSDIGDNVTELLNNAIKLAVSYPSHKNHDLIIQALIRIDTLQTLQQTYARSI